MVLEDLKTLRLGDLTLYDKVNYSKWK
jgi:hypothetical protein